MGSGENWDSYDAKELIGQINGGKGVGASSDVAAGWHELASVLRQIDDTVRQGLEGAQAEWLGHASATMTSAVSPFGEWANRADEVAVQTTDKVDSLGSFYSTARNSMPTGPMVNMADHQDNLAEQAVQLLPGAHTDQEHAEAAKQAQDQAARDAMKSYDGSTYSDAQRTYFSTPPVMTAASSGPPAPGAVPPNPVPPPQARPGDHAIPSEPGHRGIVDPRVNAQWADPGVPTSPTPSGQYSGASHVPGGVPLGAGAGAGAGHATPAPGMATSSGPAAAGSVAATSRTGVTGGPAANVSPASFGADNNWRPNGRSPGGMDAAAAGGLGMMGGTGGSGAARGAVRRRGYGDGLSFSGSAPGAGAGGVSGLGEAAGSGARGGGANGGGANGGGANGGGANGGGPNGGGARSGGPSSGVGPSEPAGTGSGARGSATGAGSAGRGGAGMGGMGAGGGRGKGEDGTEHETPDYLKQFDHFSDGRVISPPVIGAEPPERR